MLALLVVDDVEGGKVGKRRRRRERGAQIGRQGSGSKVMPAAQAAAKAAPGEGGTSVRGGKSLQGGKGVRGAGGGRKQKRGGRRGQQQGKQGRALGGRGEKSGKRATSRRPGGGAGGRRGAKKIDPKDLPDLKALPGTGFDCDEKNPRLASCPHSSLVCHL